MVFTLFEILISIFWYHLLLYINSLSPSKKSFELVKLEKFPIEKLLYISSNDTNKDNKIVMITFSDKKVYIGTVHRNLNLLKNFSENHNIFKGSFEMENALNRVGLYDFFTILLSGMTAIIINYCINGDLEDDLTKILDDKFSSIIAFLLLSYVIGMILQEISSFLKRKN